jgi:hypothetical protein
MTGQITYVPEKFFRDEAEVIEAATPDRPARADLHAGAADDASLVGQPPIRIDPAGLGPGRRYEGAVARVIGPWRKGGEGGRGPRVAARA